MKRNGTYLVEVIFVELSYKTSKVGMLEHARKY